MMMDRRLLAVVPQSRKYIAGNVLCQWIALCANIVLMGQIAQVLTRLYMGEPVNLPGVTVVLLLAAGVRFLAALISSQMSFRSASFVKQALRSRIYSKLLRLSSTYRRYVQTSEIVQTAVEGVDQLETYFGAYLPQFFYALAAPFTLFLVLVFIAPKPAVILLIGVPLIPVSIALVQTLAKKLLARYWGQYTALGDTFLENLQGLTTLKIYQSDGWKHEQMNEESEKFRRITMKVLTMQLNSITIMDLIAYGGAALGMAVAIVEFRQSHIDLASCLLVMLLAADFFLPMRLLGSYFHIAMNGMAASDRIFQLLDLPEPKTQDQKCPSGEILCQDLSFAYTPDVPVLHHVSLRFPAGKLTAITGESGCGKSTLASLLMKRNQADCGRITINGLDLKEIDPEGLMEQITCISNQSWIFQGTIRDNLLIADPAATEEAMWKVLRQVKLAEFLEGEQGLETPVQEEGRNLSGGQRQRLALARALLHDTPVYIFDEATSNIDVESENYIMEQIVELAKTKTVILISHRLANVEKADSIYLMEKGRIREHGNHRQLLENQGPYAALWKSQDQLENFEKEEE